MTCNDINNTHNINNMHNINNINNINDINDIRHIINIKNKGPAHWDPAYATKRQARSLKIAIYTQSQK